MLTMLPLLLDQGGQARPRHREHADEVHTDDAAEVRDRLLLGSGEAPDPGDVAEDVRLADVLDDPLHHRVDVLGVAHVDAERVGLPAGVTDRRGGRLRARVVQVEAGDGRAVGPEAVGRGLSDAGRGTGHHHDLPVEPVLSAHDHPSRSSRTSDATRPPLRTRPGARRQPLRHGGQEAVGVGALGPADLRLGLTRVRFEVVGADQGEERDGDVAGIHRVGVVVGGEPVTLAGSENSVLVEPGTNSCAVTPVPSRSANNPSVYSSSAAFDAAYAPTPIAIMRVPVDDTLTMRP